MKPEVQELMDKARRSLKVAEKISKDGEVDFAGSRAYYAMFYVAEALLLQRGLAFFQSFCRYSEFWKGVCKNWYIESQVP